MDAIINGFLWALALLFTLRLYRTNRQFNQIINKLFNWFVNFHQNTHKKVPFGAIGYTLILAIFVLIYSLIVSAQNGNFTDTFLITVLILIPTIPMLLNTFRQTQTPDSQKVVNLINRGEIKDEEIDQLKLAIKQYYQVKYSPKTKTEKDPGLLDKIINQVAILIVCVIHPDYIARLTIPKITAVPLFKNFFYASAYHARFKPYWNICDLINQYGYSSPFRIQIVNIDVDEDRVVFELLNQGKHLKSRVKTLAAKIEKEYGLVKDAILIQDTDEGLKLFIPKESLT